ncbi:MAG: ribosome-associated translation inhibitor RaiA [Spirochaetes bacterium]|nr:ribosome-associated translation inhibitor RaiA [Spirochaetota bacterium]
MKINITGRHFDISNDLSEYAEKKLSKLEKYFHKLIDINVIMYMEKHLHVIEATINADSTKFYATEQANDMYSSIDMLVKSLEKQVVKNKEKHTGHKVTPVLKAAQPESASENRTEVLFKQIGNKPKDELEAFLEMKVDNMDFILFKKHDNSENNDKFENYAVIYKSGNGFKMAEIPQDILKENDLIVHDDSITNPKIKIVECNEKSIKNLQIDSAVEEILSSSGNFLPFLNNDTNNLNIIYRNGETLEIMVPPN